MKAEDLMLGNYGMLYGKHLCRILEIKRTVFMIEFCDTGNTDKIQVEHDSIEPIPITEEWLLKFGFKQRGTGFITDGKEELAFYKKHVDIFRRRRKDDFYVKRVDVYLDINIQYVHQLMNLFYALTGTELTLK